MTSVKKYSRVYPETDDDEIVISGMAGKFPNSNNTDEYKYNLYNKVDMVDDEERRWKHFSPEIPKRAGKIYGVEKFDATFFGVHYKQAHAMDPQSRLLVERAYEAVIDSGINPISIRGSKTGVYVGSCMSESEKTWFYEKVSSGGFGITGCSRAMWANRVSYSLGLEGPSFLLDTACSSSMYALDNAFTAMRNGEIDAAIVCGANVLLHPFVTLQFARLGVLAQDGYCRPFDKDAKGYVRSEAINCVFLQKKRDAKRIYASVIYSKANCDGYKPEGITYPSGLVQGKLLQQIYKIIDPNDLGYLEAHSTGTVVGDPEECLAIDNMICSRRKEPLLVGSVKSNLGHAEPASAINSIIKVCLAFDSGLIAPNINFNEIHPSIPVLQQGRLVVVKDVTPLPKSKPYIGINSFGFGGANAHAVFKGHNKAKKNFGLPEDDLPRIVTWAGRTDAAVHEVLNAIEKRPLDAEFIGLLQNTQEEDVTGMVFRGYGIFAKNGKEPANVLAKDVQHYTGRKRPIVWVFSGMGSQWNEMGKSLMLIPRFRESIEVCHKTLQSKGLDLINILTSDDVSIYANILHSFVGIAAVQIGLTDLLRSLNLEPDFIIGHSVGELGCSYADGGLTAEQMILAAYYRGKVSGNAKKIKGAMAAVGMGYNEMKNIVPESIEVACHNGPDSCTISGPCDDVTQFVAELKSKNVFAKEVPCSNIAYHSRYIAHLGPQLLQHMKKTITNPKSRSAKWLSTSVPKSDWDQPERKLCSAEYHTNNLLSSVLFEETFDLLPKNALTIEIAPHGLLGAILKRSMPDGIHIPLTNRGNKNNEIFFMTALGKLYQNGVMLPVANLYPEIQFPVSKSTPSIGSLVRWDHSEDWFVTKYENMQTKASGERIFNVSLQDDSNDFIIGHVIDGKVLVPATSYLQYVWETFSLMYHGPSYVDVPVEFEDVQFLRATNMSVNQEVELNVMITYGTGHFEITEANVLVVTGKIREIESPTIPEVHNFKTDSEFPMVTKKDFYKELKLRGYHYSGVFRAVKKARSDGLYGQIAWDYNWVPFMDAMLQIQILGTDLRSLVLPTKIRKLRINGTHHFDVVNKMDPDNLVIDVYVDHKNERIVAGGIEIIGLHASAVQRRRPPGIPVLEKYEFLPNMPTPTLSTLNAARVCVQIALENISILKVKMVEVDTDGRDTVLNKFLDAIEDLPLITGEFIHLTNKKIAENTSIHTENGKLSTLSNYHFVVAGGICGDKNEDVIKTARNVLVDSGFLLIRERTTTNIASLNLSEQFRLITVIPIEGNEEVFLLLQKVSQKLQIQPTVVKVSDSDKNFKWISQVQSALSASSPVVVYAFNEEFNGLVGLVNCLRKEPDGDLVKCFYIDDKNAPEFNLLDPFYSTQFSLGLAFNIYRNGSWGSFRHLQLPVNDEVKPRADHIYGNVIQRGDLSSLRWFEGSHDLEHATIKIAYSSLNFRDVMLATGRLAVETTGSSRFDHSCFLGLEYSGINMQTGKRIMGMVPKGGVSSYVYPTRLLFEIPDHWSLEDAATVPVVYITVYYAFFLKTDIRKGKSILIHAGTGGIGLSAIRVALAYNLEVFTTCSTPKKKQLLLDTFPQLKESHIGNSRDTSFEQMVQRETDGKGVDFVLNSLSEDKLLASVRCLGQSGHFLEIGKFDMANDTKLGMGCFLKELTIHSVMADNLLEASDEDILPLKQMINNDIASGIIHPLPATVFPAYEMEQAFRHLIGGKHIGKVLIKIRETPEAKETLPVRVLSQIYFKPHLTYIIPGGLGGFGMELADWMILRGARKLVLSSSRGITKDYQSYRIALWKTYGCEIVVNTADISTIEGCRNLLQDAALMGPVGGIFNLAVVLRDGIFANQTLELFVQSFSPKATATKHLDALSRTLCPQLEHFVIFSSVSCGRGNAGQTNYGMANSVMERIIERRNRDGLPAKAIQWGAVGEVGLVADMAEDKIDLEIGGTLQQRISSCLQELDTLLSDKAAIVASMVVAEKLSGRSGNENIIETVMNIMGIRDLKSVSLSSTLSEMGMDSLMAVEIKQTLERDFELVLTPQELRALTFQKLQELVEAKEKDNDAVRMIFASENKLTGMDLLVRNLGDESHCDQIMYPLTCSEASNVSIPPRIIITGIEGTVGQAWYNIGSKLKNRASVLQLHQFGKLKTLSELGHQSLDHVKKLLKPTEPFYLIGYSFGTIVALQLAAHLESLGFRGHVTLIDGAPHFLKKLSNSFLGENFTDGKLYDVLFSTIANLINPEASKDTLLEIFYKLKTQKEKMDLFMEHVTKQTLYSKKYCKDIVEAVFNRTKILSTLDLNSIVGLKSPIMLVRPAEVSLQDIDEDYCLSQVTSGKVLLKVIEGNHTSMLDNPALPQIINDFDPSLKEDKSFETFVKAPNTLSKIKKF